MGQRWVVVVVLLLAVVFFLVSEVNQTKDFLFVYQQGYYNTRNVVAIPTDQSRRVVPTTPTSPRQSDIVLLPSNEEPSSISSRNTSFRRGSSTNTAYNETFDHRIIISNDSTLVEQHAGGTPLLPLGTRNVSYPNICLFGSSRFFLSKTTTKSFAMNLLTFLRDVSLRSFNDAILAEHAKVHVLIPIESYQPHFRSWQEIVHWLQPVIFDL
jgi:hypothetical protein